MLRVSQAQEQDRGLYACLASNEAGEAWRNFSVEVLGTWQPCPCGGPRSLCFLPGSFQTQAGKGSSQALLPRLYPKSLP